MRNACKSILTLKDEDLEGWEVFVLFPASNLETLETRKRIAEMNGWNVQAYLNDHLPDHIHCRKNGVEIVVYCKTLELKIRKGNPKKNDTRRLLKGLRRQRVRLCRLYRLVVAARLGI